MTQLSKLKILLGLIYLLIVTFVTFLFFYYEIYSYVNADFIKNNRQNIFKYLDKHIFFNSFMFLIFCIIWFFLLGFGFPLIIVAGFAFGSILGSVLLLLGFSFGTLLLYIFANYYFKDLVFKYFANRYKNLNIHFKNNDFAYLLFLRLVPGLPSQATSLIPILFNMNLKNYFFASLIGSTPSIIILVSLVSGISSKVEEGVNFDINLLSDPQISFPLAALAIMVLVVNYIKKSFFKKKNE
jgi:uncharacterized membrane protein YdjX (TVP38/TMEM64 family)